MLDLIRRFLAMLFSGKREEVEPEELLSGERAAQPMILGAGRRAFSFFDSYVEHPGKDPYPGSDPGAVAALCAFLFWLYKKYNSQVPDNGDILEKLETPEKETRERMKKKGIFIPDFLKSRTPKARIRKAYRRKIEAAGKAFCLCVPQGAGRSGRHSPGRKKRRISQVI